MSKKLNHADSADRSLERAASQIRDAEPDPQLVAEASSRVWADLLKQGARRGMKVVRDDDLPDHSVPDNVATFGRRQQAERPPASRRWGLWALAALLVIGVGFAQLLVRQMWPQGPSAEVVTVDGQLFRVSSASQVPIEPGTQIAEHELVRTGRSGGAVVRLADGSLVELRERSELSIDESRRGTTLELARGSLIVEAAKQRGGRHLYVETDECLVSVVGTIFSVNHGTKGSRVSVIEGKVRVAQNGEENVLEPGQQVATHAFLGHVPVEKEIAWSRSLEDYLEVLRQYSEIQDVLEQVPRPGARYSTRLLDLMPEETVFFASAPNLSETLTETHRVLSERLEESPELADWWASEAAGDFQGHLSDLIDTFGELGSYIGDELAVGGYTKADGDLGGVVALVDVLDGAGLRAFIEQQIADNVDAEDIEEVYQHLVFVDDPAALPATDNDDDLFLWLDDVRGIGVASPSAADVRRVADLLDGAANAFVGTEFHQEIASRYYEGVEFLVAADLGTVVAMANSSENAEEHGAQLEAIGAANVDLLVLEQKRAAGKTHHSAAITFEGERQGVASWLAAPAPMGALDYVSPDAKLVAAVVFKDPVALLDDVFDLMGDEAELDGLHAFEEKYGLSLRDDVAGALGGELVIAVDGPVLPKPAWKAILEVYDPARVQWALESAIDEANVHLASEGEKAIALQTSEMGGRTIYTLPAKVVDVHYTFVEGYMIMAADKALIDQALRYESSGYSILSAKKFSSLLPPGGENNLSALVYQDLGAMAASVAERLAKGSLTEQQRAQLEAYTADAEPTLGYAFGETDRITVAASSDGDLVTGVLLRVLGLKNPAGMEASLQELFGG